MGAGVIVILALAVFSLGLSGYALWRDAPPLWRFAPPAPVSTGGAPVFEKILDYTAPAGQAHSPSILPDEDGGFRIAWFEGSQEAQADVDIHAVRFTRDGRGWRQAGAPAPLITRGALGRAMVPRQLVVTLGNTVPNEAAADSVYTTVVSVGGWAMASVADVRLGENGGVARARKLNLSPFLNRSHLVKSPMVACADGSHALPAYFEMGAAHGTLVRFDRRGRVRDTRRMIGKGVKAIQPMVVVLDELRAVAFLRDFDPSGTLWTSRTGDGGQSWSRVEPAGIPNPSAPVAALPMGRGRILMATNDDAGDAGRLRLALSENEGATWRALRTLEDDGGDARYPMLRLMPGGDILLAYSHGTKRGIRAWRFNAAWVVAQ